MINGAYITHTVASPHAHGGTSVTRAMLYVQIALVPATLYAFWLYGWPSFFVWLTTVAASVGFEFICLRLKGERRLRATLQDGSAALTGWLLALTLPPWSPWWVAVLGAFIAIVVAKQVFGGLGQNVFNPAMVARIALLVSFPVVLTQWQVPFAMSKMAAPDFLFSLHYFLTGGSLPDALTSASLLGYSKTEMARGLDLLQALPSAPIPSWMGARPGSLGESSAVFLLIGGGFLLVTRVISWPIPLTVLLGLALPAAIAHGVNPARYLSPEVHLLSGAAVLGAFFIATDYVTSPNTVVGQLVFGAGIGLLTWVIRTWGGYPEGMAFAVLLMNAATPVIDRLIRPRILGRTRNGKPVPLPLAQMAKKGAR